MEPFLDVVARIPRVRSRLALDCASPPEDGVDWSVVSDAVLGSFSELEHDLRSREPAIEYKRGKTRGGVVELFAYCKVWLPSRMNAEAIVVGVTIQRNGQALLLSADVSGEESGRIYLREEPRSVEPQRTSVLANAAVELAEHLARSADDINDAVHRSAEV
jgi:hypothetical protein